MEKKDSTPVAAEFPRLCNADTWSSVLDDPAPRAVRWASSSDIFGAAWSKWHYSEGNGAFTACNRPIVPFLADGSPEETEVPRINCRLCRAKVKKLNPALLADKPFEGPEEDEVDGDDDDGDDL